MQVGKLINGIGLLVVGGGLIYYGRSVNGKWWIIWGVFLVLSGLTSVSMSFSRPEGKLCTPTGLPSPNGKYVYDTEGECVMKGCADGYALSSDGPTTCIKIGDLCTPPADAPNVNGKPYVYDTAGKCSFQGCVDGYTLLKDGKTCFKEGSVCTAAVPVENSNVFKYSATGDCLLDSCITGYTPKSGVCTQDNIETVVVDKPAAGAACTPANTSQGATGYITDAAGNCTLVSGCGSDFAVVADKTRCEPV